MKLSKLSQLFLVSAIGLIVASFLTACNLVTIDYVFVACSAGSSPGSDGQIYTYAVDAKSGALRTAASPVDSGGSGPAAWPPLPTLTISMSPTRETTPLFTSPSSGHGNLAKKDSITLVNVPVSIAVNAAGTYLYVVSGTSSATLTEYALSSGVIGSATATFSLTVPGFSTDNIMPTGRHRARQRHGRLRHRL
jgi:6-phosphogluconolactonase